MVIQHDGDLCLGDDALDEDTAVPSHLPAKFDENVFVRGPGFGERISQSRMPFHRAAIVEMRMCICLGHLNPPQ